MIVQNVSGKEIKIIELRKVIPANRGYYKIPYPIAYKYRKYLKPIQLKDEFVEYKNTENGGEITSPPEVDVNTITLSEPETIKLSEIEAIKEKEIKGPASLLDLIDQDKSSKKSVAKGVKSTTDTTKKKDTPKKKRGRPKKAELADKKEEVTTDKVDDKTKESK